MAFTTLGAHGVGEEMDSSCEIRPLPDTSWAPVSSFVCFADGGIVVVDFHFWKVCISMSLCQPIKRECVWLRIHDWQLVLMKKKRVMFATWAITYKTKLRPSHKTQFWGKEWRATKAVPDKVWNETAHDTSVSLHTQIPPTCVRSLRTKARAG